MATRIQVVAKPEQLADADAIIFGTPARCG
jgi:multimeric flavodoxin WrbA